jgi:hypothetical protein
MHDVILKLSKPVYERLLQHLLPRSGTREEAAFLFTHALTTKETTVFSYVDWWPIRSQEFAIHSAFHLEMGDETRAKIIKKAHDLNCSLIEFHSHPKARRAAFSLSDAIGLAEFVPHVWWRLKNRPYAAFVVAPNSFDGLAWIESPKQANPIKAISVDGRELQPTGISYKTRQEHDDRPF